MKIQDVVSEVKEKSGKKGPYWIIITEKNGDFFTSNKEWATSKGQPKVIDYREPSAGYTQRWISEPRQYAPRPAQDPKKWDELMGAITEIQAQLVGLEAKIDAIERAVIKLPF